MRVRLTPKNVLRLAPGPPGRYRDYYDTVVPGFMLRVKEVDAGGEREVRRFYALRYRIDGARQRHHVANALAVTLNKARKVAQALLGDVAHGVNLKARRAEARNLARTRRQRGTVADLVRRFVEARERDLRANTLRSWRGLLANHIQDSPVGRMTPADVTRRQVRETLESIAKKYPTTANRILELVRVAFAWAVDREEIPATPCVGLKKTPEAKRERALSHGELRRVLLALDVEETGKRSEDLEKLVAEMAPATKKAKPAAEKAEAAAETTEQAEEEEAPAPHPLEAHAWRLILLTGLRLKEVLGGSWAEVDLKARRWTLPAERMKGGRAHVVPLSSEAHETLSSLRKLAGSSPWIVQSPRDRKKPLATLQHSLARIQKLSATTGWSAHDLRHTLRSELSAHGVGFEVKELILAHALPSLAGVYDHHSYLPERAAALECWAQTLAKIESGEKTVGAEIVPFSGRRTS